MIHNYTLEEKKNMRLKVPIFYTQEYLSAEQQKLEARQANDANFIENDIERAEAKFEKKK